MENSFLHHVVIGTLVLMLGAPAVGAQDNAQDTPANDTPAQQYETLLKEYRRAASSGRVVSDEECLQFVG
jgi:hypothetical protein